MEYSARASAIGELVEDIAPRAPDLSWSSVRYLLDVDEVEEAMDVVVAILVRDNVPITLAQRGRVREIQGAFPMDAHGRRIYRYLGDPEMLDRMTVVDEPPT